MSGNERKDSEENGIERFHRSGIHPSRRRFCGVQFWRIDWTCPHCGEESLRGDWYEEHELPAFKRAIAIETWSCPNCGQSAAPGAGALRYTPHGRATGKDPGPNHDR